MPDNSCRQAIRRHWPRELWKQAYVVAQKENGKSNPRATLHNTNRTVDMGCFQVNTVHYEAGKWRGKWAGRDSAFDPDVNAQIALDIYNGNGRSWSPWCAVRDWYWFGKGCGRK